MSEEYNNNMDLDSGIQSVSLDNRKTQLTQKVELSSKIEDTADAFSPYDKVQKPQPIAMAATEKKAVTAPLSMSLDGTQQGVAQKVELQKNTPQNTPDYGAIPQLNDNSGEKGGSNPYSSPVMMNDYTGGMAVPKQKLSSGLKIYLTVIIGLCIIFLGVFVYECYRAYHQNGLFGGDIERFLDTDYDFNFAFPESSDTDSSTEDETDDKSDDDAKVSTDSGGVIRKSAPEEDSLYNSDSAKLSVKDQPSDIDSANYSARTAYKKVENSVVNIVTYADTVGDEGYKTGTGSGIILTADGYIATNSHVVNDSRKTPTEVILNNGESYAAKIVGVDVRTDLAVIKIDAQNLTPVGFVNSDQIEVGQDAIAVGSPGGVKYSNSLTRGCVSALNRTVKSNSLVPYIQTDAAINPGNSGGPLLNSAGQVMGINTIKIANSDYEGMGFAIPSNTVVSIVNDIIRQGYVSGRVRIGITGVSVPTGTTKGVLVKEIADDSPLKNTDLKPEDIITAINGEKIDGMPALFSELSKYMPGDQVTISAVRVPTNSSKSENIEVSIILVADNGETQD